MSCKRIHHLIARHCVWWCVVGILLAAAQPFIAAHFCHDGLEDGGEFHVRGISASSAFEPDDRAGHADHRETTLFAPAEASIDLPQALQHGIDDLLALVLLLVPLMVALALLMKAVERFIPERVPSISGAPPPPAPWRTQPPKTASPLAN